ncbi:MAG: glycosyltransferase family 4 protein [Planctomycetes bacterium]|nr:glycosyltransferase family 4 protein [Planctomycetota bacterium]
MEPPPRVPRAGARGARRGARRVVCVSELVRRELAELYPASIDRLVTIPNAVDLERFDPRERARSGAELRRALGVDVERGESVLLIGCAARNPELKGVPVLFDALARITRLPWTCVVAGPRERAPWERRVRALGLAGRVRIVEHVDAQAFAAACDVAVLPTWRDTCGLFVLEALASGTPAITTARAGAAECLADPRAGSVLARSGDKELLARELERWLARVAGAADGASSDAAAARAGHGSDACASTADRALREAARAAVATRGFGPWLDAFEALLADVRAEKAPERVRA